MRVGGRVAYRRASLVSWLETREIRGLGGTGPPRVSITIRPYHNDPTRHHVDVRLEDPRTTGQIIRRRLVAPAGMDAAAARIWGEAQAKELLRAVVRQVRGEEEAKPPAAKPSAETAGATNTAPACMTMSELWDMFTAGYIVRQKPGTQETYVTIWHRHLRPIIGDTPIDLVDRKALARVISKAEDKNLEPGYIAQIQAKLFRALRWAMTKGHMPEAVLPKIEHDAGPKPRKKTKAIYSPADLAKLLSVAKTPADQALVLLAWHGALRIGEIPALMWADIDWSTGIMTIARNVHKSRLQHTPKGEAGPVKMSPQVIAALKRMQRDDGSPFVFPPGAKTDLPHWTDPSARKRMQALQRTAGLPVHGPHRIRHSVLTHLANKGVSAYALQAFARHSNMRTTLTYYVHLERAVQSGIAVDALASDDVKPAGKAKRARGKALGNALGNDLANSGNAPEFGSRVLN